MKWTTSSVPTVPGTFLVSILIGMLPMVTLVLVVAEAMMWAVRVLNDDVVYVKVVLVLVL